MNGRTGALLSGDFRPCTPAALLSEARPTAADRQPPDREKPRWPGDTRTNPRLPGVRPGEKCASDHPAGQHKANGHRSSELPPGTEEAPSDQGSQASSSRTDGPPGRVGPLTASTTGPDVQNPRFCAATRRSPSTGEPAQLGGSACVLRDLLYHSAVSWCRPSDAAVADADSVRHGCSGGRCRASCRRCCGRRPWPPLARSRGVPAGSHGRLPEGRQGLSAARPGLAHALKRAASSDPPVASPGL